MPAASRPPANACATRPSTDGGSDPSSGRRRRPPARHATDLGDDAERGRRRTAASTGSAAAAYARRARGERKRPRHGWASLTPTEHQVVALIADGLTNPQIATRLLMGQATVKTHLAHIFNKLGVPTRAQLAGEATRRARS